MKNKKKEELDQNVNPEVQPDVQPDVQPEVQPEVQPDVQPEVENELDQNVNPEVETEQEEQNNEESFVSFKAKLVDCSKLNVRKEPSLNAKVLCVVDENSELEVVDDCANEGFYKVVTAAGIEGYCVKKYLISK